MAINKQIQESNQLLRRSGDGGGGGEGGGGGGGLGTVAKIAGFVAALTLAERELKSFAAAASPKAMQQLDQSWQLLKATVGTALVPGLVLLSTTFVTAADQVMDKFMPSLDDVAKWWQDKVPEFEKAANAIAEMTVAALDFAGKLAKPGSLDLAGALKEKADADVKGMDLDRQIKAMQAAEARGENPFPNAKPLSAFQAPRGEPGDFSDADAAAAGGKKKSTFAENLRGLVADLRRSAGGAGGFGGIADAWKQIQVQSFQSNMQQKFLNIAEQILRMTSKIAGNTEELQPAVED